MEVLGFLSDAFISLRDICGTICIIGIVLFIVLWLLGGRNVKYRYWQNIPPANQTIQKPPESIGKTKKRRIGKKDKVIDVKPEKTDEEDREKKLFEKFDKGEADSGLED